MELNKNTVFDYETHSKNFINYLEVIIFKDGHIEYAVPSHQLKLIDIYCKENNIKKEKLYELIPLSDSPNDWIIYEIGVISVWYDFIRYRDITKEQEESLKKLVDTKCINSKYQKFKIIKNKYGNLVSENEE